jgi:hypothetical protein
MPSRNQTQLAVEFAQGRFGQPFDDCFSFMPFCPIISNQQMSPSLEAVIEGPASNNLYGVCLDCAPII